MSEEKEGGGSLKSILIGLASTIEKKQLHLRL
jgi:hypothetical protein